MANVNLSTGVIARIQNGDQPSEMTLQVLAARKFPTGERCRLLVSDGQYTSGFAILASQLSHMVASGEVTANTVVNITKYFCNDVQNNKKMMIVLEMNVVMAAEEAGGVIGSPQAYQPEEGGRREQPAAAPAPRTTPSVMPAASVQRNLPNNDASAPSPQAPQGLPNVRPIQTLTPYQHKWTIRARVTSKSAVRHWNNSRGEGKLFSMDLLDESGEIRATAFKEECDRLFDIIETNNVYYISGGQLKTANKQYSSLKNDYEMTFNSSTQVIPCHEDAAIPAMQYNFLGLEQLESVAKDTLVDLVAVCREAAEISTVTQRSTGRELKKRDIVLVDHTNKSVNLTIWGDQAEAFDGANNPVLAIKGAKVSDFGGVSLSLVQSSNLQMNPDIGEAHQLMGWWEKTGSTSSDIVSLSGQRGAGQGVTANTVMKTFRECQQDGLGSSDQPDYYTNKAIVTMVRKENLLYMACPSEKCNKKVLDMSNGMYRCEKCNKEFDRFNWRLLLSANCVDYTDNYWVTMFQEQGEALLGISSNDLALLRDEDPDKFQKVLNNAAFKEYIFKFRVKMETFNDESRLKTLVQSLHPINYKDHNRRLIKEIKEMSNCA